MTGPRCRFTTRLETLDLLRPRHSFPKQHQSSYSTTANMSTMGSPGGRQVVSKPSPPERGSFPLDHDAECQPIMKQYLRCLRSHRGVNDDECRTLSQSYLKCRMDR